MWDCGSVRQPSNPAEDFQVALVSIVHIHLRENKECFPVSPNMKKKDGAK